MSEGAQAVVEIQCAVKTDDIPDDADIRLWVQSALRAAGADHALEVSVKIVGADEMQVLNRDFRGTDKATNVLSFPAGSAATEPAAVNAPLGDIAVCAAVVRQEAEQQEKSVSDHWAHMLVHGTLHLLGYDHERDAEAIDMEALETKILEALGIPDPYRV